jgi:hypothetical protein
MAVRNLGQYMLSNIERLPVLKNISTIRQIKKALKLSTLPE